jgi:hypothetical protein
MRGEKKQIMKGDSLINELSVSKILILVPLSRGWRFNRDCVRKFSDL